MSKGNLFIFLSITRIYCSAFPVAFSRLPFHPFSGLSNHQWCSRSVVATRKRSNVSLFSSTSESEYKTIEGIDEVYETEQVIKKSRFIGIARRCTNWADAQEYIRGIRKEHPKARHVCFGLCCGVNPGTERASDDGEPTGTAAAPILGAIRGDNLSDTLCVVVRYYGGIKLGAGGLIRAYGGAAREVLREAPKEILIPQSTTRIEVDSSYAGSVYDAVRRVGGEAFDETYDATGNFQLNIVCETSKVQRLLDTLKDATRGNVAVIIDNDESL